MLTNNNSDTQLNFILICHSTPILNQVFIKLLSCLHPSFTLSVNCMLLFHRLVIQMLMNLFFPLFSSPISLPLMSPLVSLFTVCPISFIHCQYVNTFSSCQKEDELSGHKHNKSFSYAHTVHHMQYPIPI